jgi:pimeloyl-ACP methyl ester carboxylesterase
MSITTIGKRLIHYEVLGRGEPLIFIHGWLGSWRYWWPSMQALSSRHRTFAFDLWGFGDSSKAADIYSLDSYVEMVGQFIDQLGIYRPVTLVGHALGAAVGLTFATKNPDRVEKLVAVSLPLAGAQINERLMNSAPELFLAKVVGKANIFSEVESEIRKTDASAMNQSAAELAAYDTAADLAACSRPVLTVVGDQDMVVQPPANDADALQDVDNGRYFVSLVDCHHFPMLQEKAKFNRLILDFVQADETVTELAPKEYWTRRIR